MHLFSLILLEVSVLTYTMKQRPPWEASTCSVSQDIPALYGTWGVITIFTKVKNVWDLVWHFIICSFHAQKLSAPYPTPKLQDHTLLAVWDCLFNIIAAITVNICKPPLTSWRHAILLWQTVLWIVIDLIWDTWYEHCAIGDLSNLIYFHFVIKNLNIASLGTCEAGQHEHHSTKDLET